ncbi:MAG: hypothetical protein O3C28_05230 [Proteobacteria bacterium]|nr:hypothetical protein [Pseudomonadota bacterium]
MSDATLPASFSDLQPWTSWALATERERSDKRQASSMEEILVFYNALLPRAEAALEYLEQYPLERMPADANMLLLLTLSLAEVAPAVELFGQPGVVDGYDVRRFQPERRG